MTPSELKTLAGSEKLLVLAEAAEAFARVIRLRLQPRGNDADILNDLCRGMSLRDCAAAYGIGVGRVRGIRDRARANQGATDE